MTPPPDSQDSNNLSKTKYNTLEVFKDLPDPRSKPNLFHQLFDIMSIAICGILSGADDKNGTPLMVHLIDFVDRKNLSLPLWGGCRNRWKISSGLT